MDISELLLLLVFIGLPLLRFVMERLGVGGDEAEAPPEEEGEEKREIPPAAPRAPRQPRRQAGPPTRPRGWSEEWGEWPATTLEDLTAEEVVSQEEAEDVLALQERAPLRESSEAARVTLPVVSLENLHVDRRAEHERFHALTATPLPRGTPRKHDLALRTQADLRRAVLVAEILGPPRALRESIPGDS